MTQLSYTKELEDEVSVELHYIHEEQIPRSVFLEGN